jgi:hypothetical protein
MNDRHTTVDHRLDDEIVDLGAEDATLVPVVAEADGTFTPVSDGGDKVVEGEVLGYVQVGEDA